MSLRVESLGLEEKTTIGCDGGPSNKPNHPGPITRAKTKQQLEELANMVMEASLCTSMTQGMAQLNSRVLVYSKGGV